MLYHVFFFTLVAGCAFLKYETKEQALAALEAINGKHKMEVCLYLFDLCLKIYLQMSALECRCLFPRYILILSGV